ncbi:WD40 repeat-like protein [Hesseltinella vesiculosa]|uniref:WD40 repeat-like protein n=1 Tax=Hesseltinella vesiculosa TaxID=101127 RepID=A0A1X2GN35_9FUNG|nr:WD40 repeat-like protein [Hesseltinella vesiculosa]
MTFTSLAYKPNASQLVAGCQNGQIKFFQADAPNEYIELVDDHQEGHPVQALGTTNKHLVSASTDGKVVLFDIDDNMFTNMLIRSAEPIRDISVARDGRKVAVASDENIIRILLTDPGSSNSMVQLQGHIKTVKSVAFDPQQRYLVSSDCDGTVIVWDLEMSPPSPIKLFKHQIAPSLPDTQLNHSIAWHPRGAYFVMPDRQGKLQLVTRKKWAVAHTLANNKNDIMAVAWSPDGQYLAAGGKHKQISIWDIAKRKIFAQKNAGSDVTALAWHPHRHDLAYATIDGEALDIWTDCAPETTQGSSMTASAPDFLNDMADADELNLMDGDHSILGDNEDQILDDGDDVDDENLFSDDMDSIHPDGNDQQRPAQQPPMMAPGPVTSLDWPIRFQPGSTKFKDMATPTTPHESERRYLDFNMVGCVYTIYQASHSIINVDLHDQSEHRNFHFSDYLHYTMAALASSGLALAVEGQETVKEKKPRERDQQDLEDLENLDEDEDDDDDDNEPKIEYTASILSYRPLSSVSTQKEWSVHLPLGEDVEAVAINDNALLAVTSKGYVRIYSLSGVQTHIFCVQDVVSVVARSDLALLVCAVGPTLNNAQQNLEYILFSSSENDILHRGQLPISIESELTWIGFSETCQPAAYDSKCILRVLHRQRRPGQAAWVPVFDGVAHAARIGRTETYWPIGLLQDRLMSIVLRGQNKEPYFPVPTASEVELRMPTAAMDNQYDTLEEALLRKRVNTMHERDEASATDTAEQYAPELMQADLDMDRFILQLIQMACKNGRLNRALDLAQTLHMARSMDAAIRIAARDQHSALAERMVDIKEQQFLNQDREVNHHSTSLEQFQESQVDLFPSATSTMKSDLAFIDRDTSEASLFLPSRKRAAPVDPNELDVSGIDFNDDFEDSMDLSPLPKRSR